MDIDPIDERIDWINKVTELGQAGNHRAVWQSIVENDDEHLHGLSFMLILARVDNSERVGDH